MGNKNFDRAPIFDRLVASGGIDVRPTTESRSIYVSGVVDGYIALLLGATPKWPKIRGWNVPKREIPISAIQRILTENSIDVRAEVLVAGELCPKLNGLGGMSMGGMEFLERVNPLLPREPAYKLNHFFGPRW